MTTKNIKLKNAAGDYLEPYTENIPVASTTQAGKVQLDNTPTADSLNALTSGGAKTALDTKLDATATAVKATADADGNTITATYATKTELSTVDATAQSAKSIAEGRSRGVAFADYAALVENLNTADKSAYRVGDNLFIQAKEVPDLWVYSVEEVSSPYTFESNDVFVEALGNAGFIQIGHFKMAVMETAKVDLSGYVPTERTINGKPLTANIILTAEDIGALTSGGTADKAVADADGNNIATTYAKLSDIISFEEM